MLYVNSKATEQSAHPHSLLSSMRCAVNSDRFHLHAVIDDYDQVERIRM